MAVTDQLFRGFYKPLSNTGGDVPGIALVNTSNGIQFSSNELY